MDTTRLLRLTCGALLLLAAPVLAGPTGSVVGTVHLAGPPPARPLLPVFKHEEVCGKGVPDDRLVVSRLRGVRWAVVTVDGVPAGAPRPEGDPGVVLDNHDCRFAPHVLVAEVGQTLELHNSDPILHNADARLGVETVFNFALPPNRTIHRKLDRAGTIAVTCDVRHSWMNAFIVVTDHPFHTTTDAYGVFEIDDLPPGTYTLRVWHEELGTLEQPLTIAEGQVATVDATYPATAAVRTPAHHP